MFEVSRNEMYIVQGPKLQCFENLISMFVRSLLLVLTYYFGTKVAMNQKQNMSVSAALLTT